MVVGQTERFENEDIHS